MKIRETGQEPRSERGRERERRTERVLHLEFALEVSGVCVIRGPGRKPDAGGCHPAGFKASANISQHQLSPPLTTNLRLHGSFSASRPAGGLIEPEIKLSKSPHLEFISL